MAHQLMSYSRLWFLNRYRITNQLELLCCRLVYCRSQWPRGLRRRFAAARLLRLWVRVPPGAWMDVCCECCVLSGRRLCDEPITRPEESYRLCCVVVCDLETSWMRSPWPTGGCRARNKEVFTARQKEDNRINIAQCCPQTVQCIVQHDLCVQPFCIDCLGVPLALAVGWGGGWVVNVTPRPLYPRQRVPVPTVVETGRATWQILAGVEKRKCLAPIRFWTPDRPARSDSTYGLRYPGPCLKFIIR